MSGQDGRVYEGDVSRIARMLLDEIQREKKQEGAIFKMSGGFPGGANEQSVNTGGQGNPEPMAEPTYYALVPSGGDETITFTDIDKFFGINLFFHYFRGDVATATIFGSGHLFILHNGATVLRCDLIETTGPLAGFDDVAEVPHGFSAVISGTDIVLTIAADASDADDINFYAKPVYQSHS